MRGAAKCDLATGCRVPLLALLALLHGPAMGKFIFFATEESGWNRMRVRRRRASLPEIFIVALSPQSLAKPAVRGPVGSLLTCLVPARPASRPAQAAAAVRGLTSPGCRRCSPCGPSPACPATARSSTAASRAAHIHIPPPRRGRRSPRPRRTPATRTRDRTIGQGRRMPPTTTLPAAPAAPPGRAERGDAAPHRVGPDTRRTTSLLTPAEGPAPCEGSARPPCERPPRLPASDWPPPGRTRPAAPSGPRAAPHGEAPLAPTYPTGPLRRPLEFPGLSRLASVVASLF